MEAFIAELLKIVEVSCDEPMKNHTTFKIGGPAKWLAEPKDKEQLKRILALSDKFGVRPLVIGRGSDLLVSDDGIDTLVVKLGDKFSHIEVDGTKVTADAGASLSAIAARAQKEGLSGFEFASGIPGSLGGAVYMNAGAYGGEMKDVVKKSFYLDKGKDGGIECECTEHEFAYRKSFYTDKELVITGAVLELTRGDKDEISAKMAELSKKRREKQPVTMPSAGSVFKRPVGYYAGTLIDEAGLKGYSIGGAMVSEKHAGFIVNTGSATAKDVKELIEYIRETVYKKSGVMLEPEIKSI